MFGFVNNTTSASAELLLETIVAELSVDQWVHVAIQGGRAIRYPARAGYLGPVVCKGYNHKQPPKERDSAEKGYREEVLRVGLSVLAPRSISCKKRTIPKTTKGMA